MKIEAHQSSDIKNFSNLKLGTPIWHDLNLWIKTELKLNSLGNPTINAMRLSDARMGYFSDTNQNWTLAKVKIVNE